MSVLKAGLIVSLGLLAGRVLGFVREVVIAREYGSTLQADQIVLMLTVPDMLINILAGGALSAALVPEFTRLTSGEKKALLVQATLAAFTGFGLLASLFALASLQLVALLAPGMAPGGVAETSELLSLVLWVLPLTAAAGVSTALLQVNKQFLVPALGTCIFNIFAIIGLLMASQGESAALEMLAAALILGAFIRLLSQWARLARGVLRDVGITARILLNNQLIVRYLQALSAGSILLLLPVIYRSLASLQGDGGLAKFNYALRLIEFPLGVGLTVLTVVLFPYIAKLINDKGKAGAEATVGFGLTLTVVLSIAMGLPLILYSDIVALLVFGGNSALNDQSIYQISFLALLGFLSLPARALSILLLTVFNAHLDMKTPLFISAVAIVLAVPLGLLSEALWGLEGLMMCLGGLYYLVVSLQLIVLSYRYQYRLFSTLVTARSVAAILSGCLFSLGLYGITAGTENYFFDILMMLFCGGVILLLWVLCNKNWFIDQWADLRAL